MKKIVQINTVDYVLAKVMIANFADPVLVNCRRLCRLQGCAKILYKYNFVWNKDIFGELQVH